MGKRVLIENFVDNLEFQRMESGYNVAKGAGVYDVVPDMNGRTTGKVDCPCCGTTNYVYLWSLAGSGKRCGGCNVVLGYGHAIWKDADARQPGKQKNRMIEKFKAAGE